MARGLSESFKVDEGTNRHGIHTELIFQGDEVVQKQTFDASPILEAAKAERIATAGDRWGEMRKVGTIPIAIYNRIVATYKTQEERRAAVLQFLKGNENFVTFDKFLKS